MCGSRDVQCIVDNGDQVSKLLQFHVVLQKKTRL